MDTRVDNRLIELFGQETRDLIANQRCYSELRKLIRYIYEQTDQLVIHSYEENVREYLYYIYGKRKTHKIIESAEYSVFKSILETSSDEAYIPDICYTFIRDTVKRIGGINYRLRYSMMTRNPRVRRDTNHLVQDDYVLDNDSEETLLTNRMYHVYGDIIDDQAQFQRKHRQVFIEYSRLVIRAQSVDKHVLEIRVQIIKQWSEKLVSEFALHVNDHTIQYQGFKNNDKPLIRIKIDNVICRVKSLATSRCDLVKALNDELNNLKQEMCVKAP